MCALKPPPGAVGLTMSPELAAALEELRGLRLALAAEVEAHREQDRQLEAVTADRDRLLFAARMATIEYRPPTCEVCGKPAASPVDFLYWPSTPERPTGDGVRHVVHPECTEALAKRLATAAPLP